MADYNTYRFRQNPRLKGYDYAQSGAYFVTICAYQREHLFGEIANEVMQVNNCGEVVNECWNILAHHHTGVTTADFVVMPNHFHGVLFLESSALTNPSLLTVIGSFKSAVSRRINVLRDRPAVPVWQRSYHERIIRDEAELIRICQYIAENPLKWATDRENHSAS